MDLIQTGRLALPRFQRPAVWRATDWIPFLTSVLLNRPTGTLLVLEVGADSDDFAPRKIEGGPPLKKALKWLLLDGQQRTTTLFRAFRDGFKVGRGPVKQAVIDVAGALSAGELREEHLELRSGADVAGEHLMAQVGLVTLRTLLEDGTRLPWLNTFAEGRSDGTDRGLAQLIREIDEVIPAFSSLGGYTFPVLKIDDTAPLEVVVDIFENMNRRGQRLSPFDLMVARLYRKTAGGSFYDLRAEWTSALDSSPSLKALGVDPEDGMLPLQLIAMQVSRLQSGARPEKVRGLANKDVLELPADQIIGHPKRPGPIKTLSLQVAVGALEEAADFLKQHCGVVGAPLLPQQSMLLPLADQFLRKPGARLGLSDLKRWFFASGLSIRYYGGVNTFAYNDCNDLADWASSGSVPDVVSKFTQRQARNLQLQQPFSREGNILGSALMALLVSNGALDWRVGQFSVAGLAEDVQFHHMVPEKILKQLGVAKDEQRLIAALTPITASRNASIRDQAPSQVLQELGRDANTILASHLVDRDLLEKGAVTSDAFKAMVSDREERLRDFVVQALGL